MDYEGDHKKTFFDSLIIEDFTYYDVYAFYNAKADSLPPSEEVYLNFEYGILKIIEHPSNSVFRIVR